MSISTKKNHNSLLMFTLTLGVFGILNTEMGVVGIIPIIADTFGVTVPDAGWTVSLFALIIAFSAPVVPLLFSRVNRKTVMVLALSVFVISNLVSVFTTNFTVPFRHSFIRCTYPSLFQLPPRPSVGRKLRKPFPKSSPEYRREWCSEYL